MQIFAPVSSGRSAVARGKSLAKDAREAKDSAKTAELKAEISSLRREKAEIAAEIKKATDQYSVFSRAAKPFLDARRTLAMSESYSRYEEIISGAGALS